MKTEVANKLETEAVPVTAVATPPSSTSPRVLSSEKKSRRHTGDDATNATASHCPPPSKVWKGLKYKYWTPGAVQPAVKYKKPTDKEITEVTNCVHAFVLSVPFFPSHVEKGKYFGPTVHEVHVAVNFGFRN
jgi:hypothetical protein